MLLQSQMGRRMWGTLLTPEAPPLAQQWARMRGRQPGNSGRINTGRTLQRMELMLLQLLKGGSPDGSAPRRALAKSSLMLIKKEIKSLLQKRALINFRAGLERLSLLQVSHKGSGPQMQKMHKRLK